MNDNDSKLTDPELIAMQKIADALEDIELDDDGRNRILEWAVDKYYTEIK